MKIKFGRNDLCFCGSGVKYKKCHALLESEEKVSIGLIRHDLIKEFRKPTCLFPIGHKHACSKKLIASHSIQKSKVLGKIINSDNKVMTFYQSASSEPNLIGWNKASTFNGFCSTHDDSLFSAVEKEYIKPTSEQIFVLGYRGFCHELYQKTAALRSQSELSDKLLKGHSAEYMQSVLPYISASNLGVKKGQKEFENIKNNILDPAILVGNYNGFSSLCIEFTGDQVVASCGAISPDYDINNIEIQKLHDVHCEAHHMSVSLINEIDKIVFLMFWPSESAVCNIFCRSLEGLENDALIKSIFSIIFGYLENTYFSEKWWLDLSIGQKEEIFSLSSNVFYSRYFPQISFVPTDWKVTGFIKNYE